MKYNFMIIFVAVFIVSSMPNVMAEYRLLCLDRSETVRFSLCNSHIPDRSCDSDFGCQFCTNMISEGVYCPTSVNVCNSLGLGCSYLANRTVDTQPPILSIISPISMHNYNSRSILFDLLLNEIGDIYYLDNLNGRGRWSRVCSNCVEYSGRRSFNEGNNSITFRANDGLGNTRYVNLSFFIDSKKPRIIKTTPSNGFTDGTFFVTFKEDNPALLILHYGNPLVGYRNIELDLGLCARNLGRTYCNTGANLIDYDGQEIEYWFNLTDISSFSHASRRLGVDVDVTYPDIVDLDFEVISGFVNFNISIEEENLDSVDYMDNSELRPRWRTLCSRLNDGRCIARKSFSDGNHNVNIQVRDDAGNSVTENINFVV